MKAILYAAGTGTRLGPLGRALPKILLPIGGRTLLEWHIDSLASAGVDELVIVTGHLREQVCESLRTLPNRKKLNLREVVNPDYREGSVLSLRASLPEISSARNPVLLMDGDVLHPRKMLSRLISSSEPTALLIDREYYAADDDPVLVPVRQGRPVELCKGWHGSADQVGECVGFFKVSPEDVPMLVTETNRRTEGAGRQDSFEEVLRAMVLDGRFGFEDVTGLPWTEIDFVGDVARAVEVVLPAILKLNAPSAANELNHHREFSS